MKKADAIRIMVPLLAVLLGACASVADLKDFPASSAEIDFDDVSARINGIDDASGNSEDSADYLAVVESESAERLTALITEALQDNGYTLVKSDRSNGVVFAERGMRVNEYESIAGVYFETASGAFAVYARVDITQGLTGGWKENRARQVLDRLCELAPCKPHATG